MAEIIIHFNESQCKHVDYIHIDSCYFVRFQYQCINGTYSNISQLTNHKFFCHETNNFLVFLFPNILQGFLVLLVFMTALEFTWAQASLRPKGLLIGIWYTSLAGDHVLQLVESASIFSGKKSPGRCCMR